MSLGGYAAALWAGLDRLDFVIPVVPLVSLPHFVTAVASELGVSSNIPSSETLEEIYRVHSPLRFRPKVPNKGRLIIAAMEDKILSPLHAKALSSHWEGSKILWLSGGHLDQMIATYALDSIHQFLRGLGMAEREPLPLEI